jgi:hypothetical protein
MLAPMRRALAFALLMFACAGTGATARGPVMLDQGFTGFGPAPAPMPDLAPPAPEPPRTELPATGLRLGFGGVLSPSMLEQLDAHDPHRLLERLSGDGAASGLSPYLPERLGATLTFPF